MEQVWRQTEHPGDGDGLKSAFKRVRFPINKERNMNMREPTTMWDRAPTDAELGYTRSELAREQAEEHYKGLISIAFQALSHQKPLNPELICLPVVSYKDSKMGKKDVYPIVDAIRDYMDYPKPESALLAVLINSTCPYVAALKQSLITQYEESHLDELVEFDIERGRDE